MYFAAEANVNVGVITTIWSVNPLFMAIVDYIVFKQQLKYYHVLGTISIVLCTIVISLSGVVEGKGDVAVETEIEPMTPTWVPVLFGLITPISFTTNGVLTKHLTSDRVNFNASTLSFNAYLVVNALVLLVAVPYWSLVEFDLRMFWIGLVGSVLNTLGIVCIQNALSCGPAGPTSAIVALASILLVVIEAVKNQKMLTAMESIGLLLGLYGALVLVIPGFFANLFCFCCLDKLKDETPENQSILK